MLTLAFLPYEAWFSLDAIVRTGWRMLVSRRHLLEWRPRAWPAPAPTSNRQLAQHVVRAALAVGVAVLLTFLNPSRCSPAAPVLLLWFLSP
jgi:cyclic beta-1,2-glucan synthetase